jgi:hypothetical protein
LKRNPGMLLANHSLPPPCLGADRGASNPWRKFAFGGRVAFPDQGALPRFALPKRHAAQRFTTRNAIFGFHGSRGSDDIDPAEHRSSAGSRCFWRPIRRISAKRGNTKQDTISQHHLPIADRTPRPNSIALVDHVEDAADNERGANDRRAIPRTAAEVAALPNRVILFRRYSDPRLVDCPFNQRRGRGASFSRSVCVSWFLIACPSLMSYASFALGRQCARHSPKPRAEHR